MGADEDLAGQAKACVDRLRALTSGGGEAPLAADRVGGKVLCVQQHPSVQVIDSLALESPLAMLHWVGWGDITRPDCSLDPSRYEVFLLNLALIIQVFLMFLISAVKHAKIENITS